MFNQGPVSKPSSPWTKITSVSAAATSPARAHYDEKPFAEQASHSEMLYAAPIGTIAPLVCALSSDCRSRQSICAHQPPRDAGAVISSRPHARPFTSLQVRKPSDFVRQILTSRNLRPEHVTAMPAGLSPLFSLINALSSADGLVVTARSGAAKAAGIPTRARALRTAAK